MNPQDHVDEADWNEQCIRLFRNEASTIVFQDPIRVYARRRRKIGVEVIDGPFKGCRWEQSIFPEHPVKAQELVDAAGLEPGVQYKRPLARALLGKTVRAILRPKGWQSLKVQKWLPMDDEQELAAADPQHEGPER